MLLVLDHSVQFSCSVMSDCLRPHEPQHARPPCPSPTPRVHPKQCPLSWWCHPTISFSVIPFSSCPQSFPTSGSLSKTKKKKNRGRREPNLAWIREVWGMLKCLEPWLTWFTASLIYKCRWDLQNCVLWIFLSICISKMHSIFSAVLIARADYKFYNP